MTDIRRGPAVPATQENDCCCGPKTIGPLTYRQVPIEGRIETVRGAIDRVSARWRAGDYLGAVGVRLGIGRTNYAVKPGLYAAGRPTPASPVVVSANYKLSFDVLRRETGRLDLWVLVLDTRGINVWCAAGKGTFGTMEIARKVTETGLPDIASTRTLIVPQLGAPGVAAHMVKAFCGFDVVYGPVRASDLPRFLAGGLRATAGMRRVTFTAGERLAVAWLEAALALRAGLPASLGILLLGGLAQHLLQLPQVWPTVAFLLVLLWGAIVAGTLLTALLLPSLPGRMFSVRGGIMGAAVGGALLLARTAAGGEPFSPIASLALVAATAAVAAYLALNFTGSSTFTSLSGVKKEIRLSLPVIVAVAAGATLWLLAEVLS